jgi:hypothetical protein
MRRIILCLFTIMAAGIAWSLTLSDIETQVRYNARDTSSSASLQRYSDTVLDGFINEVQREVVNLTWCVEASTSYTLTAATTYYDLPTDLISIRLVTFTDANGMTVTLDENSEKKVFEDEPDYESSSTGQPSEYMVRLSTTGDNPLEIAYIPIPTSSSTGTVRVYYYCQVTDLSSNSDVPFNGFNHLYPYHYAIVAGATERIKMIEGRTDEAAVYTAVYQRYLTTMKDRLNRSSNYSPSFKGAPK